ncbi:hypothetical protein FRC14_006772 [Serendipita sp. 396]|nr:hypothetical protein FRC14_006772 [Serendipita sp. 396]KAG8786713.1 hypothetical protein FRC15_010853 [Serendipita sp. 397]KAG8802258.1 hypothetical protein FRC16_010073 [Serendipita sp. 398]KAG8827796.1 hypothetical protein FRC19_000301 [Serendipita sp. 401]KAG8870739.1 hypothetical protein FRC20_011377 [Serendipita sp. 405]
MTTLDVLPYDILYDVLCWLDQESRKEVSRVSKSLRLVATPLIFRNIRIEKWYYGVVPNTREMAEVILSNEAIAGSIRVLNMGLRRALSDPFQKNQHTILASIARLLTSLPSLTCLILDLPAQYAEPLFAEFKADAKNLVSLRSLVTPSWVWAPLAQFCPHLRGFQVESQAPWTPGENITWLAQLCLNVTVFVCFEGISTATIKTLTEYLPHLEELGLLGAVEEKEVVDYLEDFRAFRKLHTLWLPPARQLKMNLKSLFPGPIRLASTEKRLMSAIESLLISKGGPNVNLVILGWSCRVATYRRIPGDGFQLESAQDIHGRYRGGMLDPRQPTIGTSLNVI